MLYPRGIAAEKLPLFNFDYATYHCVVEALWFEARSEPEAGIAAVLSVIANRKQHKHYPDEYCKVVQQPKQFSYRNGWSGMSYRNGVSEITKTGKLINIRYNFSEIPKLQIIQDYAYRAATASFKPTLDSNVISYHNTTVAPQWAKQMQFHKRIGRHLFYSQNSWERIK